MIHEPWFIASAIVLSWIAVFILTGIFMALGIIIRTMLGKQWYHGQRQTNTTSPTSVNQSKHTYSTEEVLQLDRWDRLSKRSEK